MTTKPNACKDCKRSDIPIKPFRTDFVCRPCYEALHFKKFKQYFYQSMNKKDHAVVFIINDHTITFEYTMKLINMAIDEEKRKRVQVYFIEVVVIDKDEIKDLPFHLYERMIISKSKDMNIESTKKIIFLDGSNTTMKSSRILTSITQGDVITVPSIGRWSYKYDIQKEDSEIKYQLTVSRPIDFTEDEVLEYMQSDKKIERIENDCLEKRCQQFLDKLMVEFDHTANTIIATAQRVVEEDDYHKCKCCLKPFKPFLNDCEDGLCRTCHSLDIYQTIESEYPF